MINQPIILSTIAYQPSKQGKYYYTIPSCAVWLEFRLDVDFSTSDDDTDIENSIWFQVLCRQMMSGLGNSDEIHLQ